MGLSLMPSSFLQFASVAYIAHVSHGVYNQTGSRRLNFQPIIVIKA